MDSSTQQTTPKLALVAGHYPCFQDITGLDFKISIVMSATDITFEQSLLRQRQAEKLVAAFNAHDQLVAALQELYATVKGECPSLLNEDSGGSAHLDFQVQDALAAAGAA